MNSPAERRLPTLGCNRGSKAHVRDHACAKELGAAPRVAGFHVWRLRALLEITTIGSTASGSEFLERLLVSFPERIV